MDWGPPEALPLVSTSVDRNRWYVVVEERVFFLDTGYSVTTCDDDYVAELDLEPRGRVRVHGEAGSLWAEAVRLPGLELGGHHLGAVRCLVRDLDATSSVRDPTEVAVAGVIGSDVLRAFRVVIDPETAEVELLDPRDAAPIPRDAPGVVRMRREFWLGTRPTVPVRVGDRRAWPVLDTGASGTHLDGEHLGLVPVRVREDVIVRGSGSAGSVVRDLVFYEETVELGGYEIGPVTVTGRERSPWTAGLLGLNVLSGFRQEYDFRRGRARFVPVDEAKVPSYRRYEAAGAGARAADTTEDAP